ncbi:MAG: S-layer homology domain-containing protein [Actinobacteria bacterium]|nr:S-layer homology domain-containing protein [Actinomycetota bacterium]
MRRSSKRTYLRFVVILAVACTLAGFALASFSSPVAAGPTSFTDIKGTEDFAQAVYALAEKGIVEGRQDGSFGPGDSLTRAQMAVFLARALQLPEASGQPFFDVRASDWFGGAVGALFQQGLIQGTSPITFSPNQPISLQQAVSLVMRSLGYFLGSNPGQTVDFELTKEQAPVWLAGFRDRERIAAAHRISVANAYRLGVLNGSGDGWLFPEGNLSRAQMALLLYRAFLQPIQARNTYPLESPAVSNYPSLAVDSKGSLVSFLEAKLSALHYPCGPLDGVYDYRTKDAVMAFEKVERLKRDGRVGADVWQRLLTALPPTPHLSAAGTRVEVDLTRQVLFMITDNKVWKVVHVSTGRLGTRTGHFSIGAKYEGWVPLVTLEGFFYYPSYIVSKTAIHGYPSVPPYPASHGCVRVPIWMTKELYYQLPRGTTVDVFYLE